MNVISLFDTKLPADTVQAVPSLPGRDGETHLITVGTYLYDPETKVRITKQTISGPGVLDIKWKQTDEGRCRCLWARSDGAISLGHLTNDDEEIMVDQTISLEDNAIVMSADLQADLGRCSGALSSGRVALYDSQSTAAVTLLRGHELEAWEVVFDKHSPNVLHSGGDDAVWCVWDLRTQEATVRSRWHQAGVCSIQPHLKDPNVIATGSYDKRLAIWDRRNLMRPLKCLDPAAKSGVWKLCWHPSGDFRILAACMYDGFRVLDVNPLLPQPREMIKYDPEALCYGCSWLDDSTAISCSFYNHQLQIWKVP